MAERRSRPLTIIRQRRKRRVHVRRSAERRLARFSKGIGYIASLLAVLALLAATLAYAGLTENLPPVETLTILLDPQDGLLLEPTRLYDRTGEHMLAALAPQDGQRLYVPFDELPAALIDATLAMADPDFWTHPGYRLEGWRDPGVSPTLAQDLAADLLLWAEAPSTRRALRERILAAQITHAYGREQVLEWYLNSTGFGNHAYGIEAAARLYFGKPASDLDLGEAALLAAVSRSPALNPFDAPIAAEQRRQDALQAMLDLGLVSAEEASQADEQPPAIQPHRQPDPGIAPAFVNLVVDQLGLHLDRERVQRGGLEVITSLDYDLQLQAMCAIQATLSQTAPDAETCPAAGFIPAHATIPLLPDAQASALVVDPRSGQILALVGDVHADRQGSYLMAHPAGTALTPFIYLTGFTRGFSPASLGWDIPGSLANLDGRYHGPVRLRIALVNDYLPPAARLLDQMGVESVRRLAEPFGLTIPSGTGLLADDITISPLTLARAYAIFANQGVATGQPVSATGLTPVGVLQVNGGDDSVWVDWSMTGLQAVVSPQLAYLMNHVLSDEVARWPGFGNPNPLDIDRPAGVKVSQSFDRRSAWVVGYTPQRVVVVWVGTAAGAQTPSGNEPARLAANLWNGLTRYAVRDLPPSGWELPAGVVEVNVCDPSGLLPTSACPSMVREVFLAGNEPIQADNLYQVFLVNRETGLLATVFTPAELVEERIYMVVPEEARAWAQAAAIPAPPSAFDTVQMQPYLAEVHITSPVLFADVRAAVRIRGSATGEEFAYYRLEYGRGLNPRTWVQIGSDFTTPVAEDLLAEWNTGPLDGLYALRLMVIRSDQRVEQAVIQVAVDNTAPQIVILSPQEGLEYADRQIILQVQVDEPHLARVTFTVDGVQVAERVAPPFTVGWQASAGEHTLQVMAVDRAGNQSEVELRFRVTR
ncbi:MAG: penicillin-binding protein [Chloroflexota bacterium]